MKVVVIESHEETVRNLLSTINKLNGAVEQVDTYSSFHQFIRLLSAKGQPDLLMVDMNDLDAKARRFLKSGRLTSAVILTNSLKQQAYQFLPNQESVAVLQHLSQREYGHVQVIEREPSVGHDGPLRTEAQPSHFESLWQDRFLVKSNQRMLVVEADQVSHFFSEGRLVFVKTKDGKKFVVQFTLEQLILKLLNPKIFFRVNRSYVISFSAIKELHPYPGSRMKVILHSSPEEEILVSRENVNYFRKWLGE